jgi:hypothetical protein
MLRFVFAAVSAGVVAAIATVAALASFPAAHAQADVQIASVNCNGDPEEVVLENGGDATQDLSSWQLVSDPVDSETFDLSGVGALQPSASIFIRSGPAATGVFKWSESFIFRDDDETDFVRLLDDAGETIDELACGAAAPPSQTPAATPGATPEPATDIPDGGGAPPLDGSGLSSSLMVVMGGGLAAAGAAALALARRLRPAGLPFGRMPDLRSAVTGAAPAKAKEDGGSARAARSRPGFGMAVLGLATLALLLWLVRRS